MGKDAKGSWKTEYDDEIYKIYDWEKRLAGYFFPQYGRIEPEDQHEAAIEELNKSHAVLTGGGHLLVPMLRLGLLDSQEALAIDDAIESLSAGASRASNWREWLAANSRSFSIYGAGVHTAREDRNMLSIALAISGNLTLGEKEVGQFLMPLLDKLHEDGLL